MRREQVQEMGAGTGDGSRHRRYSIWEQILQVESDAGNRSWCTLWKQVQEQDLNMHANTCSPLPPQATLGCFHLPEATVWSQRAKNCLEHCSKKPLERCNAVEIGRIIVLVKLHTHYLVGYKEPYPLKIGKSIVV